MTARTFSWDRTPRLLGPLNPFEQRHAPAWLHVAGHAEWLAERPKASVVGSRMASADGLRRASRLSRELAEAGVIVVSGLAVGVDEAAHRAAVEAGGKTIAVIGTAPIRCSLRGTVRCRTGWRLSTLSCRSSLQGLRSHAATSLAGIEQWR